jgi:beta-aspartyl-peptidase (threonine type)
MPEPVLAVHGGAGRIPDDPDWAEVAGRGLRQSLELGRSVLSRGGDALEAVVAAVEVLEDCEVLNAGRGSVLTRDGGVEMDAAVMAGDGGRAGAVACVSRIAHPVRAALLVLRDGRHVLLAGDGAEALARAGGCPEADPESFVTSRRRTQLERRETPRDGATVGAVARDARGHLAAATSTGGTAGKLAGRISDSCQIGAGTWADDATCAVSATGDGELFVRTAFAHEVDALVRHAGLPLTEACEHALARVSAAGGDGGCIAVDREGGLALPFTAARMARGFVDAAGTLLVQPT